MKSNLVHIINSQKVEIIFEELENSIGMQNKIMEVFYEKLQPGMEMLFNELIGEKYFVSIDNLEIDTGILTYKNWEGELVEQTLRKLKDKLMTIDKKKIGIEDYPAFAAESFLFFLENGFMPWNSRVTSIKEIEQNITFDEKMVLRLYELFLEKHTVLERLMNQFSERFIERILLSLLEEKQLFYDENSVQTFFKTIEKLVEDSAQKREIVQNVFKNFEIKPKDTTTGQSADEFNKNTEVDFQKGKEPECEQSDQKKKFKDQTKPELIYINNSGLIILHPYLKTLFESAGYLENNNWLGEEMKQRAIALTQYIITGAEEFFEFEVMLNKILCGYDLEKTLPAIIKLSDFEKDEGNDLLLTVISQWTALKNTGIEALRETFLKREGKLSSEKNGWFLHVERREVMDILLDRIPWELSRIKLPWMKNFLYVEWRY